MTRFKHTQIELPYDRLIQETRESGRTYRHPTGRAYPSITTVLKHRSEASLQEWRARVGDKEANKVGAQAARRGTKIHDLMERYVAGEEINVSKLMPHHRASFDKIRKILDSRLSEYFTQEVALFSDHLGVAGTSDLIGRFDGVKSIIDFKTSRRVKKKEWISSYFIQGCAYSIMWEEQTGMSVPNIVIIMDIDSHEPVVFKEHRDNWVDELKSTIEEYHRLQRCRPVS